MRKNGWKLVEASTGREVEPGEEFTCHNEPAPVKLEGGTPPHKPSSEGRIVTRPPGARYAHESYPSVCGLKWVEAPDSISADDVRAMQNLAMKIRRCIADGKNLNLVEAEMVLLLDRVEPMLRAQLAR